MLARFSCSRRRVSSVTRAEKYRVSTWSEICLSVFSWVMSAIRREMSAMPSDTIWAPLKATVVEILKVIYGVIEIFIGPRSIL